MGVITYLEVPAIGDVRTIFFVVLVALFVVVIVVILAILLSILRRECSINDAFSVMRFPPSKALKPETEEGVAPDVVKAAPEPVELESCVDARGWIKVVIDRCQRSEEVFGRGMGRMPSQKGKADKDVFNFKRPVVSAASAIHHITCA